MRNFKKTTVTLLFLLLVPVAYSTSPGDPKGDYLSTMPLAATLAPGSSCPSDSTACPNSSTVCCPKSTTCLKKQDQHGVPGWGCCTTAHMGSTCPLLLSNEKCAVQGWVVCGGVDGKTKSATCCEKVELCRDTGKGVWDCGAESNAGVGENQTEGNQAGVNQTETTGPSTTVTDLVMETNGGTGLGVGVGMGVGVAAIAGWWVV